MYLVELDQVYKIREASNTPVSDLVNCEDDDLDPRKAFLLREWQQVLAHIDVYYRPVTEFMVLTMMIGSEIEALTQKAVSGDVIRVQLKKTKKDIIIPLLKTKVRKRNIPMTNKLREILTTAMSRTENSYEFVFTMADGCEFDYGRYIKDIWNPALKAAGLDHRVGYSARHTGIAWSMLVKVDHERLTGLTGHADKNMIYKQYGKYRDGLYEERDLILDYLGRDYLLDGELRAFWAAGPPEGPETGTADTKIAVFPVQNFSDNFGDKKRLFADNYSM